MSGLGLGDGSTVSSLPFYAPAVAIRPDGIAKVSVKLSDDLTVFKLRAKAVSGAERLGFGTGRRPVRLPVIVQRALPRFVRPGRAGLLSAARGSPIGLVAQRLLKPLVAEQLDEGVDRYVEAV